jgi:hypothetical protein
MSKRWDRFTTRELQALDEYFRNVAGIRPHSEDIRKLAGEVAAALRRRNIMPFGGTGFAKL